jgi:hypothetical protein
MSKGALIEHEDLLAFKNAEIHALTEELVMERARRIDAEREADLLFCALKQQIERQENTL